jgi:thiol-disulfide isomerase/thioredoxin
MVENMIGLMLFFLAVCSFCQPISLTDATADSVLNNTKNLPVLIYVWESWCPHCQQFQSSWLNLTNFPDYQDRILFADLQCASNRALCHKLSPGRNFPRFIWLDAPGRPIVHYSGDPNLKDLSHFIKSRFTSWLHIIKSGSELQSLFADPTESSLFLFNVSASDNSTIEIVTNATFSKRHFPAKFALIPNSAPIEPSISLLRADQRLIRFDGQLSLESLSKWLSLRALPFFTPYSASAGLFGELEKVPIAIFVFPFGNAELKTEALGLARNFSWYILTAHSNCKADPVFCRYVGVSDDGIGRIVIVNVSAGAFWVRKFSDDSFEWLERVLAGKVRGGGPGDGFLADMWAFVYEMRGRGGWQYYLLFAPVVVGGLGVSALFAYLFLCDRPPPKKTRVD